MNNDLRSELLRMQSEDIVVRRELIDAGEFYKYECHPRMADIHGKNNARMREIVEQYGWAGRSLVGEDGCEAAWKVVQHATLDPELRQRCVVLLTEAVAAGEAPAWQLAMLTDSVLFQEGKPQVYGCITMGDGKGGAVLWELSGSANVDARREEVGLPPLQENMKRISDEVDFVLSMQRKAEEAQNMGINILGSPARLIRRSK